MVSNTPGSLPARRHIYIQSCVRKVHVVPFLASKILQYSLNFMSVLAAFKRFWRFSSDSVFLSLRRFSWNKCFIFNEQNSQNLYDLLSVVQMRLWSHPKSSHAGKQEPLVVHAANLYNRRCTIGISFMDDTNMYFTPNTLPGLNFIPSPKKSWGRCHLKDSVLSSLVLSWIFLILRPKILSSDKI